MSLNLVIGGEEATNGEAERNDFKYWLDYNVVNVTNKRKKKPLMIL